MGRDAKDASDFFDLEAAGFEELGVFGWDAYFFDGDAFFEDGGFVGVFEAAMGGVPGFLEAVVGFVGEFAGVAEDDARDGAVAEDGGAELLGGEAKADGFAGEADEAVADDAVAAQAGDVEDALGVDGGVVVGVEAAAVEGEFDGHAVGAKGPKGEGLAASVAFDFGVVVAPEDEVGHAQLEEFKGGLAAVGGVVEEGVEGVGGGAAAVGAVTLIDEGGEAGD